MLLKITLVLKINMHINGGVFFFFFFHVKPLEVTPSLLERLLKI